MFRPVATVCRRALRVPGASRARHIANFRESFDIEFTLAPYRDVPELKMNRGDDYCMVTLRHGAFDHSVVSTQELYKVKDAAIVQHIDALFERFDAEGKGHLTKEQLREACKVIGLPDNDMVVADILQRRDRDGTGTIDKIEFTHVVEEAWGSPIEVNVDDRLEMLNHDLLGHATLSGSRAVAFVGRSSPVEFVVRACRYTWPLAFHRVGILQNVKENPDLDPAKMEMLDRPRDAVRLAELAELQDPREKGGLVARFIPMTDEESTLYVPIRGLPENGDQGIMSSISDVFSSWTAASTGRHMH
eukprot:TRINITY_DN29564_c0_g1_i1.p1 TRINITY_DN29564_c0_g1~~TRINITY_DN29564_c0_g1_i1.p1  ORF type:complete len:303 (-),score=44.75 TRINITY_DN29564_c0_g1_i1:311-1219(-)